MAQSVRADVSQLLLFEDGAFDLVFHPVSTCFVEDARPIFRECFRVLGEGEILLCGSDNGFGFLFDETGKNVKYLLPFQPVQGPRSLRGLR